MLGEKVVDDLKTQTNFQTPATLSTIEKKGRYPLVDTGVMRIRDISQESEQ